jgi:hypothetical protein
VHCQLPRGIGYRQFAAAAASLDAELRRRDTRQDRRGFGSYISVRPCHGNTAEVTFRGIAGFVRIGRSTFRVAPKFVAFNSSTEWEQVLSRMMSQGGSRAARAVAILGQSVPAEAMRLGFVEPMARHFAVSLRAALGSYPLVLYHRRSEPLPFVKGRLLMGEKLRRGDHSHLLPCNYSKLGRDNQLAALLKWAASQMRKLSKLRSTRAMLSAVEERLAEVTTPVAAHTVASLRVPPGLPAYEPLVKIARDFFLARQGRGSGWSEGMSGLLIRMPQFFEAFVSSVYRRTVFGERMVAQDEFRFAVDLEGHERRVRPDDTLRGASDEEAVLIVSDAKYKGRATSPSRLATSLAREDLYQVVCTCLAAGTSRGLVVRPAVEGHPCDEQRWVVESPLMDGAKVVVGVLFLDLTEPRDSQWSARLSKQVEGAISRLSVATS